MAKNRDILLQLMTMSREFLSIHKDVPQYLLKSLSLKRSYRLSASGALKSRCGARRRYRLAQLPPLDRGIITLADV